MDMLWSARFSPTAEALYQVAGKPFWITTSWDDGHTLDLRLADLLDKYDLRGTFYVARDYLDERLALRPSGRPAGDRRRSDDPVRTYLRKMGSVPLLTREGEVEIARRIESGAQKVLDEVLKSL